MKQESLVNRIIMELVKRNLVAPQNYSEVVPFILQAYAAGYDLGLKRQQKGKTVVQMSLDGKMIKVYNSTLEAAAAVGAHYDNIRKAARGVYHTANGYKWKYLESMK